MNRKPYSAVKIKDVDEDRLRAEVEGKSWVLGLDVGKETMVGALMEQPHEALIRIKWEHPTETREMVSLMGRLGAKTIQVALEPSGTYGDSVRHQFAKSGFLVFRVSPKRTHDSREVYDGVPSLHDGKSSMLVGMLHLQGLSDPWVERGEKEREMGAALSRMECAEKTHQQYVNRLEAQMARYWPELCHELDLGSATALRLLWEYGGPAGVCAQAGKARGLMRAVGGNFLKAKTIEGVLHSARETLGAPQVEEEKRLVSELAEEADRARVRANGARRRVEELSGEDEETRGIGSVVGKATACVLKYALGSVERHVCGESFVKCAGLNLKEKSSGKYVGQLKITKRGSGTVRWYLWMAALRLIEKGGVFKAWYDRKVQRDGGRKGRAIVALMRKLLKGLWHVGRGEKFDCGKLFDLRRLGPQWNRPGKVWSY